MKRCSAAALGLALLLAAPTAAAVEWWTPATKKCPTFPTKEACMAWCDSNRSKCRFVKHCKMHVGDEKPSCPREDR